MSTISIAENGTKCRACVLEDGAIHDETVRLDELVGQVACFLETGNH